MARREEAGLDQDLADLPADLRWREWMRRIEAVLFATASPVARGDLARVVGRGASVDLLIDDLAVDLEGRPYEVAQVGAGWMLRTKPAYAPAIRAAADVGAPPWHKDIVGRRLHQQGRFRPKLKTVFCALSRDHADRRMFNFRLIRT